MAPPAPALAIMGRMGPFMTDLACELARTADGWPPPCSALLQPEMPMAVPTTIARIGPQDLK
jgi:hypothetical protein